MFNPILCRLAVRLTLLTLLLLALAGAASVPAGAIPQSAIPSPQSAVPPARVEWDILTSGGPYPVLLLAPDNAYPHLGYGGGQAWASWDGGRTLVLYGDQAGPCPGACYPAGIFYRLTAVGQPGTLVVQFDGGIPFFLGYPGDKVPVAADWLADTLTLTLPPQQSSSP
jgi:hypothetical protein